MNRTYVTAALAALAGGPVATAQPVARHLIDDADNVEALFSTRVGASFNFVASAILLDDLNADGVRELLLTHISGIPTDATSEYLTTSVRDPSTGATLLTFGITPFIARPFAHNAAVMIDDINADAVRDIAVARALGPGALLRVYCGATGDLLASPFEKNFRFPWGLDLLPWDDVDADGQPDLIVSNIGNNQSSVPFIAWSPGSNAAQFFQPAGYPQQNSQLPVGTPMLDLGVGASGAREFLSTIAYSKIDFFGGAPTAFHATFFPNNGCCDPRLNEEVGRGAAVLGDLNADGRNEIVFTGFVFGSDGQLGMPVVSGATPNSGGFITAPLTTHAPRIVVIRGEKPLEIDPVANQTLVPLADATGDGFPDYAFIGAADIGIDDSILYVVAMCGRTGRAVFAAEFQNQAASTRFVAFTQSSNIAFLSGHRSIVSPGDLNNDGASDLLILVAQNDSGVDPPLREQLLLTHHLPTPCVGDTDFDRAVNFNDLNAVLSNFGANDITSPADLNASGVVDFADLNLVLSAFGSTCD